MWRRKDGEKLSPSIQHFQQCEKSPLAGATDAAASAISKKGEAKLREAFLVTRLHKLHLLYSQRANRITSPHKSCVILDLQSPWKRAPGRDRRDLPPPSSGTPPSVRAHWLVMLILKCSSKRAWSRRSL